MSKAARSLRCSLRPILPPSSFATDLLADSTSAWAPLTLRLPKSWGFYVCAGVIVGLAVAVVLIRHVYASIRHARGTAINLPPIPVRSSSIAASSTKGAIYWVCIGLHTSIPANSLVHFSSTSGSFSVTSSLLRSVRSECL
ncbi:hypothetical protein A0H81_13042 [Grifola frondosa]|uniref:Uncharacterized protein n=1 Tax=Grifola frondosa TaxID=5627 RepID=A0A1C7LQW5_GRIFR|nr:hypothetical protein A0H81_13042 [Grifola frondosa]